MMPPAKPLARQGTMKAAQWIFRIAGIYGVLALTPLYFLESTFTDSTHPEFYYGFIGVGLAWQALFFILAVDPVRCRLFMIPAILEKISYGAATFWLFFVGRAATSIMLGGAIDWVFVGLFLWAYVQTGRRLNVQPAMA
jgi:hypothetical protein